MADDHDHDRLERVMEDQNNYLAHFLQTLLDIKHLLVQSQHLAQAHPNEPERPLAQPNQNEQDQPEGGADPAGGKKWSDEEIGCLVAVRVSIVPNPDIRGKIWSTVSKTLNENFMIRRNAKSCKDKWYCLHKLYINRINGLEAGPEPEFWPLLSEFYQAA